MSARQAIEEWRARATILELENETLRKEIHDLRTLAFNIWLEHFENLKRRIQLEKGEHELEL